MDYLSISCILFGVLIIATRAPLIFAPTATLRWFEKAVATDTRVRGIGVLVAILAAGLVLPPHRDGAAAANLHALGWIFAFMAIFLTVAPDLYRRLVRSMLEFTQTSVDKAIVRAIGLFAVAIGAAFLYVGLYVV